MVFPYSGEIEVLLAKKLRAYKRTFLIFVADTHNNLVCLFVISTKPQKNSFIFKYLPNANCSFKVFPINNKKQENRVIYAAKYNTSLINFFLIIDFLVLYPRREVSQSRNKNATTSARVSRIKTAYMRIQE